MSTENLPSVVKSQSALPEYLQTYVKEHQSSELADLSKYWVPQRLKTKQAQSGDQYKDYHDGDVLLVPEMVLIAHAGEPFWITPIYQFTDFCKWSPYGMKGQMRVIAERTSDMNSTLAKRAMSRKEDDWYEICPEAPKARQGDRQFQYRYCEHINFVVVLRANEKFPDHPAHRYLNNPFVISFHHSGFYEGKQFATLIQNRRLPWGATQFELFTKDKSNSQGTWKGMIVSNPSFESGMSPVVTDEKDFKFYRSIYEDCKAKDEADEIRVDYEDDTSEDNEPVVDAAGKF